MTTLGDVEGEDLGAVLVEVEAVVGADVLALAVAGVDDVLGPAAVAAGEPGPRVDELHVGRAGEAARTASSWTARRAVTSGLSSLGIPTQIDRAAVGGEEVHHLAGPAGVLGQPLVLGRRPGRR